MRYSYTVKYTPGKSLVLADALSRNPEKRNANTNVIEQDTSDFVLATIKSLPASNDMLHKVREEQGKDAICQLLKKFCATKWPSKNQIPTELKEYAPLKHHFSIGDDLLLYNSRLVVPRRLQKELLLRLHEGHLGITRCRDRAKQAVWWLGLSTQLKNLILNCPNCVEHRVNPSQPFIQEDFPARPWQKIGIDLFKLDYWYVIITDYYSRYFEFFRLGSLSSKAIIEVCKEAFSRYGLPDIVRSDNGPQFTSEFKLFADQYGFLSVTSSPHFPQSNGAVEAAVKTAKNLIKKSKDDDIHLALLAYRSTPLENGFSPAELFLSRRIKSSIPTLPSRLLPAVSVTKKLKGDEAARKMRQARNFNSRHRAVELSPLKAGDPVWIIDLRTYGKIQSPSGEPRSYWVLTSNGRIRRNRFHLVPAPYKKFDPSSSNYSPGVVDDPSSGPSLVNKGRRVEEAEQNSIRPKVENMPPKTATSDKAQDDESGASSATEDDNPVETVTEPPSEITRSETTSRPQRQTNRPSWWKDYWTPS
ncbi:uncharacterized protein K02A2.6-like [Neodiprion virginianus]|uniref:uncharacterized protein K02A2.6-like n=1 Tax=Neodiprion virginianus TaxID=2961670 RepID=UPI001EE70946|nr:uncharacterized protein K02A2.6-like [Neodiprion virginianus]